MFNKVKLLGIDSFRVSSYLVIPRLSEAPGGCPFRLRVAMLNLFPSHWPSVHFEKAPFSYFPTIKVFTFLQVHSAVDLSIVRA